MWDPSAWKWGGFSILRLKSAQQGSFPAILWAAVSSSNVFCNKIDGFSGHCSNSLRSPRVVGSPCICSSKHHILLISKWSKCKFQKENSCPEKPYSGSVRTVRNWVLSIAEVFMEITGKVCPGNGFTVIKILVLNQDMAASIPKSFLHGHWARTECVKWISSNIELYESPCPSWTPHLWISNTSLIFPFRFLRISCQSFELSLSV